jgi:general secretion pathway protein B
MSFILDALRKSEHDRQRQTGPGLAEVPVAAARPKSNVWATAAIALLIVNLVAVGVVLLRRSSHDAPTAGPPATTPAPVPAPATAPTAAPIAATNTAPAPQASMTQTLPQPTLQAPVPSAPYPAATNPLEREVSAGERQDIDPGMAARAASVPAGPPAVRSTEVPRGGSVKYESAPEAGGAAAPAVAATPEQPALPTADELTARGGLPALHLDLHVYSTRPQDRFIFVNSRKYREGDTLQEGPVVEQITQAGAVLSFHGSRFLLPRD